MKLMQIFRLCCVTILFMACNDQRTRDMGNPVSGAFTILTDETFLPLVEVLASAYESAYPMVIITIDTVIPENNFEKLANDKIRSLITSLQPAESDLLALNQRNVYPSSFHFASDAVALVARKDSSVIRSFTFPASGSGCLQVSAIHKNISYITSLPRSENNSFLKSSKKLSPSCLINWYAVNNQREILQRVAAKNNETGIVGWSYLCEKESPDVIKWRTVLDVIPFESASSKLIYPTQAAIATGEYPLSRKLYLFTAEPFAGPATGFAAYVASDEGQRIIRLFGLAPAKTPPREIIVN